MSRVLEGHVEARAREVWPSHAGQHRLLALIGGGATGAVFRAIDERSGATRALKIAHETHHNAALRREIGILFRLRSRSQPGVVTILESGQTEGRAWYAMEFVEGVDLVQLGGRLWQSAQSGEAALATVPLPSDDARASVPPPSGIAQRLPEPFTEPDLAPLVAGAGQLEAVLRLGAELGRTLAELHALGVVHADISPRNVMVRPDGSPVLLDLSSAFYVGANETAREMAQPELGARGTPGYMSPEQILGLPVDGRADLYGLGCVLYELVTGRRPFVGEDPSALATQHLRARPLPPSSQVEGVSPELDQLILSLLEKEPRARLPYAYDAAHQLDALAGRPTERISVATVRRPPLYRSRVVGRSSALESLEALTRSIPNDHGSFVLLTGEIGAGKTRLLNELALLGQHSSMDVVAGRGVETRSASGTLIPRRPFEPLAGVLERLVDTIAADETGSFATDLARELPLLAAYEPGLAEWLSAHQQPVLSPEVARSRVIRAMAKVLRTLSARRPLLLLIDDLHWGDDLTVELVRGVAARELEIGPTLIAGSCRSEALDLRLLPLIETNPSIRLEIQRLGLEDVRAIARDVLATDFVPEGLSEFLFRSSGGNALFAVEYLALLVNTGSLSRISARQWVFSEPTASILPLSLQELLELSLTRLPEEARNLLEQTCVHTSGFTWETLRDTPSSADELSLATSVQELVSGGFVEEHAEGRFRFVHEELRDAIERGLDPEFRRTLHARAAERLASGSSELSLAAEAQLAHHYARLGEHALGLKHFARAAERAAEVHAYGASIDLCRAAVLQGELAFDEGSDAARTHLTPLREELADMLVRSARHEEARRHYDAIAADESSEPMVRARALRKKGKSFWLVHDYDRARTTLDKASEELGPFEALESTSELQEWIEIGQNRFWIHYFRRDIGPASAELVSQMSPVVDRVGTPKQRAMFYQCAAGEQMARERYLFSSAAVDFARRAVEFSESARYPTEAADARFALGFALVNGDRAACEEAVDQFSRAVRSLEAFADATVMARLLTYLAIAERRLGRVAAVRETAARALAAAEPARLPAYIAAAMACLAWVDWREGDKVSGERKALEADQIWQNDRHVFPFRRLSGFILLGARHAAEDFRGASETLRTLLAPQQQRLPAELDSLLRECESCLDSPDIRRPNDALTGLLTLAHQLGFD